MIQTPVLLSRETHTALENPVGTHVPRDEQTLQGLFNRKCLFKIPSYQRSYSWDRKQRKEFLEDLREHPSGAPYYYGHFIFEAGEADGVALIIDGQQRLTTLVLFVAAVVREVSGRSGLSSIDVEALADRYLSGRLETVDSDQNVFLDLIIKGTSSDRSGSRSKERLVDATRFFSKVAGRAESTTLQRWVEILENAEITTFTVHSKVQAAQIFTLQNSRGKELTNLEKLKAFLMFGIYLHAEPSEKNGAIGQVERSFGEIYRHIERIALLNEDEVLGHHDSAYSEHWEAPLDNIRRLLGSAAGTARVNAITDYANALAATFQHVIGIEELIRHEELLADPIVLDPSHSWPLLIKLYGQHGAALLSAPQLRELLRNVEIVLLKLRFQHGRSSNDLIGLTKQLDDSPGGLENLCQKLSRCVSEGFRSRGDIDPNVQSNLDGDYHYSTTFRYILWKYENSLRQAGDAQVLPMEFINSVENRRMDSTIEHIAPQNGEYADEFRRRWLNNLGNLLFMPRGLNSSLSDQQPAEKAKRLDTSYAGHREVKRIIEAEGGWSDTQIGARKATLLQFVQSRWKVQMGA